MMNLNTAAETLRTGTSVADLQNLAKGQVANYKTLKKAELADNLVGRMIAADSLMTAIAALAAPEAIETKITLTDDEQAEAKDAGVEILRAKDVATMVGTDPYAFRSFLRDLGGYDDKRYTRYGWTADSPELARVIQVWGEAKAATEAAAKAKAAEQKAAATKIEG